MGKVDNKKFNFDLDLEFGEKTEEIICDLFEGRTRMEVKSDTGIWKKTGNLVIEIRYKGRPAGISTTDADWWFNAIYDGDQPIGGFLFRTSTLKRMIKQLLHEGKADIISGGDCPVGKNLVRIPIRYLWDGYGKDTHPLIDTAMEMFNGKIVT